VVIDNDGRTDVTVWGLHDIAGTVINGVCRDVSASLSQNYPLFGRGRFMRTGKEQILKIRAAHGFAATYGSPRVWLELRRQGVRFARHDHLVLTALNHALRSRDVRSGQLIFHSDKGAQYTALRFTQRLLDAGVAPRPAAPGTASTTRWPRTSGPRSRSSSCTGPAPRSPPRTQAEHAVVRYIDGWYNPRRIQAGLGGLPPDEYDDR